MTGLFANFDNNDGDDWASISPSEMYARSPKDGSRGNRAGRMRNSGREGEDSRVNVESGGIKGRGRLRRK